MSHHVQRILLRTEITSLFHVFIYMVYLIICLDEIKKIIIHNKEKWIKTYAR